MEKKLVESARGAERAINENPQDETRVRYYSGAVAVEVIRNALRKEGFNVSPRDVFVRGFNKEIDLLVLKKDTLAEYDLLYKPNDVIAAFEIKARGVFANTGGEYAKRVAAVKDLIESFGGLKTLNKKIIYFYVTISEAKNWKDAYEVFPDKVFCLSWGNGKTPQYNEGCWERLVGRLREVAAVTVNV